MHFEWDADKARRDFQKHGVSFDVARLVFDDPRAVATFDRVVDGEER